MQAAHAMHPLLAIKQIILTFTTAMHSLLAIKQMVLATVRQRAHQCSDQTKHRMHEDITAVANRQPLQAPYHITRN
jgi:hypothetical protein